MGEAILTEIVGLLIGGIEGIAEGIGTGLSTLVTSIFVDASGTTPALTAFGVVICVFGGVALAVGLSRWVVNWVTSLGN